MKLNEILNPPLPALYQPPLDEQRSYPMYLRARHFRAIAIGCMFGGTFVGDHAGSQTGVDTTPFMKLSATTIGTYSGGVEQLCGRDAVAFSPTGRFLVFTDSELLPYSLVPRSRSFLTLDTRCVRDHGLADRCFFSGEGFDGARPVSWGERDATLFVVENRKTLVALDFGNDGTTARFAGRAELSRGAAITLTTSGTIKSRTADIEAIRLASAYFSANAQDAPRSLILKTDLWADGTVTAVSFDPDTLDASAFSARGRRSIPLSRAFLKRATLSRTQSGAAVLSDLGWTAAEAPKGWRERRSRPFAQPVASARDDRLLGYFSPTRVTSANGHDLAPLAAAVSRARSEDPGLELVAAAADPAGDHVALLRTAFRGYRLTGRAGGRPIEYRCDRAQPSPTRLAVGTIGATDRPLAFVRIDPPTPRGVAVVFQGGPSNIATDAIRLSATRSYLTHGWSVILPNYSGSAGSGVDTATRLRRDGVHAFARDAATLRRYLDRAFPGRPLIVHGESFGALPAMALEAVVGARRGGFLAGVPYLRSRPPEQWVDNDSPFDTVNIAYQRQWEAATIGVTDANRNQFNRAIATLANQRNSRRPALFIFGSWDRSSIPDDIPPPLRPNSQRRIIKATHKLALLHPMADEILEKWIDERSQ